MAGAEWWAVTLSAIAVAVAVSFARNPRGFVQAMLLLKHGWRDKTLVTPDEPARYIAAAVDARTGRSLAPRRTTPPDPPRI
jgi:hypothetical protein